MRILFLSDASLMNPASGSEQVLYHEAKGLADRGMKVLAITRGHAGQTSLRIRKVSAVEEACYSVPTTNAFLFLAKALRLTSHIYKNFIKGHVFDVAVCHQPFTFFALMVAGRLPKIPLFYIFLSPWHEEYLLANQNANAYKAIFPSTARRLIERLCLQRAQKIMVLSRYMMGKLQRIHKVAADSVVINPGGVDLDRFSPPLDRRYLKAEMKLPQAKILLLTIRNLEPRMGIDNLVKAIRILKQDTPALHLILGGEGIEKEKLTNLIKEYRLTDAITLTGFIPDELLARYYGAADFFILPTRRLEGFGLVTVEAMACGTPVLGTPVGATKEILAPFNSEFLFRDTSPEAMAEGIRSTVLRYGNDQKKYNRLRGRCREIAEKHYSWKRHLNQFSSVINDLQSKRSIV